jgi:molecular chaperone DnaK (HSP70)
LPSHVLAGTLKYGRRKVQGCFDIDPNVILKVCKIAIANDKGSMSKEEIEKMALEGSRLEVQVRG